MALDVVYKVREGERNEELRYSLRSLQSLPHDRVWIAGYKPSWVRGVGYIPWPPMVSRYASSTANVLAACRHPEVSEDFYLFDDDFFVVRPVAEVPMLHRGRARLLLERPKIATGYRQGMAMTISKLAELGHADPLSYELHVPMRVNKHGMEGAIRLGISMLGVHKRTLYGNLADVGGREVRDVKVHANEPWDAESPFLSCANRAFDAFPLGVHIRNLFPEPGPYEQ